MTGSLPLWIAPGDISGRFGLISKVALQVAKPLAEFGQQRIKRPFVTGFGLDRA